jgi:hypothetical protein
MAKETQAAERFGPHGGTPVLGTTRGVAGRQITCVPITNVSTGFDLSSVTYFGGTQWQSRFLRIICDSAFYYFWSDTAPNTDTVDETATGATNQARQADRCPADETREECASGLYLYVKSTVATAVLRISIVDKVD